MATSDRSLSQSLADRRSFIAGAMAMGLSAAAATRLAAVAQTPAASPAATGAEVDFNELGNDHVNGTFPLTEEKVTFSVLIPSNDDVESFELEDNQFTQWYEERTNIHIEWQVVPADEANTGLNVRLASGDYPEIIMDFNPAPAVQQLYGSLGTFVALNDYIDQHGVEFKRVVEQYPLATEVITAADGKIYGLPYVNDCYHCAQDRKLFIYKPWLDALGLALPTTTDEFHAMLTAFKNNDPNGNGEADELPFSSCINSWNNDIDLTTMNSFVFNPGEPYLYNDGGTIKASYMQDGWKEGVKWLATLFAEGLIDPEAFTQTSEQLIQKTSSDGPTRVGVAVGGSWGVFVTWTPDDPSLRWAEYVLAPPVKGPSGLQYSPYNPYLPFASGNFIITDKCSNPELAFKWADGLYDLETTMRSVQGVPGQGFRWANEGEIGIDGEQAIWGSVPDAPEDKSQGWVQTGPSFRSARVRSGEVLNNPELRATNLDVITKEVLEPFRQPAEMWLPPMFFTEDQVNLVAETESTVIEFVRSQFASWVTGQQPVDDTWDAYLEQLKSMGVEPYIQAHQSTFDKQQSV